MHALRRRVRHLETDRTAHRVPDEDCLVDLESIEDGHQRRGQSRDVQDVVTAVAASVPGQVRDHVHPPPGQRPRGGHEVLAGDREAVDMNDRTPSPSVLRRQWMDVPSTCSRSVIQPTSVDTAGSSHLCPAGRTSLRGSEQGQVSPMS